MYFKDKSCNQRSSFEGCAFAAAMGFPLRATAAVTMNDIVHRTISTGDYSVVEDKGMSWASAMVSVKIIPITLVTRVLSK